jgi:glutathione S-transferase
VPSGLLPAVELDGRLITESLVIMQTLEAAFPGTTAMLPPSDGPDWDRAVTYVL